MKKVAVVFWSGTGNTAAMANAVAKGAQAAGADVTKYDASNFSAGDVEKYDAIAFGCPAMGSEQLEDSEFEPMFDSVKGSLSGRNIALFGSYGWGDCEWMRSWEEGAGRCGSRSLQGARSGSRIRQAKLLRTGNASRSYILEFKTTETVDSVTEPTVSAYTALWFD